MRLRKTEVISSAVAAAMVLSLAACGGTAQPAATTAAQAETTAAQAAESAEEKAESAEAKAESAEAKAEESTGAKETEAAAQDEKHEGMKLEIPAEYQDLLITQTFPNDPEKPLFTVSEKASVEAGKANGYDEEAGPGWLFSIERVSEEKAKEMMCGDTSGADLFATDKDGNYYVFAHPTDVRLEREGDMTNEDLKQWTMLNDWAASVKDTFVKDNPELTAAKITNTEVDIALARIAYQDDVFYTLSTTEYGPKDGQAVDPSEYLELLRTNVTFEHTDEEAPDGEYVVLNFPKEETRFDFFKAEGKENYVRMVRYGDYEYETLYKGEYENDAVKASKVMQEWYDALIDAKASSVFAGRDGWMVRFDQKMIDAEETGKHSAKFTYKPGDADAKEAGTLEIRYVDGKQPQEVLGEVTEDWGDQEKIRRFEQTMPGTTDKWAFWRQMEAADSKDDTGRTAIAGEYNDGVLLLEITSKLSGDEGKDMKMSDFLAETLDSVTYRDFWPQTMYEYVPGTYSAEIDGFVSTVTLFPDHTGHLRFQDDVDIIWTSTQFLSAEDGTEFYEYTVEGDSLLVSFDGEWVSFEKEKSELHASIQRPMPSPDWVTELDAAKDEKVRQLFVVAGLGMDKTTASVSMHERDEEGEWKQILSTPGFVGKNGLCADADHKEGCGQTPIGTYHFNKAFGIAEDPDCMIPYTRVTGDTWWSGDQRDGMRYNEMVSRKQYPDLDEENSEHIADYEYEYQYCLNISFNEEGTPGRGSAIFLHCLGTKKPYTGGCVAIPENLMKMVMEKVEPDCVVVIDTLENMGGSF